MKITKIAENNKIEYFFNIKQNEILRIQRIDIENNYTIKKLIVESINNYIVFDEFDFNKNMIEPENLYLTQYMKIIAEVDETIEKRNIIRIITEIIDNEKK